MSVAAIDLRRPGTAWMVSGGDVHVFAAQLAGGAPTAPRRLLFSVASPGLMLPVPDDPALEVVAIPSPETELRELPLEALWRQAREPDHADRALASIARWVEGWLEACTDLVPNPPTRDKLVGNGPRADLPPHRILNADQELIWLRILSGEGVLLDTEDAGGPGLSLLPLAGNAWLRSFDEMHIRPVAAAALIEEGEMEKALAAFLAAAQRNLAIGLGLARIDEATRLDRRSGRIAGDIKRLIGDLGQMIGAVGPTKASADDGQDLLSVVHAVSSRVGVKAQLPASVSAADADQGASLDRILEASSLRARRITLAENWWKKSAGDFLAFDKEDRAPRAVLDLGKGHVVETPDGTRSKVTAELAARLAPEAYALYQPLPDMRQTMAQMAMFGLQGSRGDMVTILLAAALGSWASSLPAIGSRLIFESLIPQHFAGLLIQVGIALAAAAAMRSVFAYANNVAFARLRGRASARLKAALWDRVLRQNMGFFSKYSAPDLTMRVQTAENIVTAIQTLAHQSLMTLWMLAVNLGTLYWLAPPGALAATGLIVLFAGAIWLGAWGQKRAFRLGEQAEGSVTTFVHALTNGVRKLRLAGAEERAFVKWGDRFTRSRIKLIHLRRVTNMFNSFAAAYELLSLTAVLAAVALLSPEPVKVGTFFGFIIAFQACTSSMSAMGRQVMNVAFQFAAIPYAQPVLDAVPEREARKAAPGRLSGAIEFSGVAFRYGEGEAILKGVGFSVQPGEFVAIVGPTGCGKSTLIKLLLGLERPSAGAVLFDRKDLSGLDADAVRRQIGAVLQKTQLQPGTLYEVIRGQSNATLEEATEAAALAGLGPDIDAMPMGLHTAIPEGQHGFSGGQIQRLAIARAIVRKPPILILDEATSALDNVTQAEITHNLAGLSCTRIVVAHRLSTVIGADRIIVLNEGKVAESGTYTELSSAGGLFSAMAARQELN